jgi:hypothetical protein
VWFEIQVVECGSNIGRQEENGFLEVPTLERTWLIQSMGVVITVGRVYEVLDASFVPTETLRGRGTCAFGVRVGEEVEAQPG